MANAKPMTKSEIITFLAGKTNLQKKQVDEVLKQLMLLTYKEAKKSFVIPGLGKLLVVNRKKRTGRNPKTGESIVIPAKKVLKFRIAKAAKDAVLPAKKNGAVA